MIIPMWHSTTTSSLLQSPQVRHILGWYPEDLFLRIESTRPALWSTFGAATTNGASMFPAPTEDGEFAGLLDDFVTCVNSQYCIMDNEALVNVRNQLSVCLSSSSSPGGLELSRLYMALALGSASRTQRDMVSSEPVDSIRLASPGVQIALQEFTHYSGDSLVLPQTLYLIALFHGYLCRPLVSAKFLHMASLSLQQFMLRYVPIGE